MAISANVQKRRQLTTLGSVNTQDVEAYGRGRIRPDDEQAFPNLTNGLETPPDSGIETITTHSS